MSATAFYRILQQKFPFSPTVKQDIFFQLMADFATNGKTNEIFVLKGYAGTGKTSVIATLVNSLSDIRFKSVQLAPTGRAAKVIAQYSGRAAFTIHKKIYFPKKNSGGGMSFTLQPNKHKDTLFIVDEASMISDAPAESRLYENGSLLDDLISYVYSGANCKLVLLGDSAQLPPVNASDSPALNIDLLGLHYQKRVVHIELDEVMRQEEDSGILYNATQLRDQLFEEFFEEFRFQIKDFPDVIRLSDGYDIQDAIHSSYSQYSIEDTAFIVRSNKRANLYNQQIRSRILDKESQIATGDYLMIVKNNYFWLTETDQAGFMANGDIIEVMQVFGIKELYEFTFAQVKIRMVDYPEQRPIETVLLLDTLNSESPALSYDDANRLYEEVLKDYQDEPSKYKKMQKLKENEYFNALQVKFAYAMTCHKSQGGQWANVFIEQPYLPEGILDSDYFRWLYTAVTRAREKLYLIGFKDEFFEEE